MRDLRESLRAAPRDPAWVTCDPSIQGGAPCIVGTRMPVASVRWRHEADGRDGVRCSWPWLTEAQIDAALAYDGDIRDDEEREADEANALREHARAHLVAEARALMKEQIAIPDGEYLDSVLRRAALATVLALLLTDEAA